MNLPLAELVARTPSGRLGRLGENDMPEESPAHAGLWLDRVVALRPESGSENGSNGQPERARLYQVAIEALQPVADGAVRPAVASYRALFERWRRLVEAPSPGLTRRSVTVEARSRLLLHPATGETVTEGSVLLHHTYGVPYLPGSGLKGLLRSRLDRTLSRDPNKKELMDGLLGRSGDGRDLAAAVDLLDALWVPERPVGAPSSWSPLALDVVTPHHPEYYTASAGGRALPTDRDEPIPVQRLTVAPGTRFLIVAEASDAAGAGEWLESLFEHLLLPALDQDGFGAWTSIGYGRLRKPEGSGAGEPARQRDEPAMPSGPVEAIVRFEPGSGELRTVLPDGRQATANRSDTERFLAELPEALVERLRSRKRQARLLVEVEPLGRSWKITALRPIAWE